jgi:hypothetical protein
MVPLSVVNCGLLLNSKGQRAFVSELSRLINFYILRTEGLLVIVIPSSVSMLVSVNSEPFLCCSITKIYALIPKFCPSYYVPLFSVFL